MDHVVPTPTLPPNVTPALRTWVDIDLEALRHNCSVAQARLSDCKPSILAVVKADGYGLGMVPVAHAIQKLVKAFGVANVTEAETLRAAGVPTPIYILGPALPEERSRVVAGGFCPPVSDLAEVLAYGTAATNKGITLPVHVVIDTGMGRIGALPDSARAVLEAVIAHPHLHLDSIASHFPSADDAPLFTIGQAARFSALLTDFAAQGLTTELTQIANSAGLLAYHLPGHGMARAGLMLYGISPVPAQQYRLQRVLTWTTRVTVVRELPEGHGVSYGQTYHTSRLTKVATLAVGYADGFPRQASGRGAVVLLGGRRCPVLGRITMDQIMVDVTDLPTAPQPGDEAVLIGVQGDAEITAVELAQAGDTIAWDLFTGLGPRVQRCYR